MSQVQEKPKALRDRRDEVNATRTHSDDAEDDLPPWAGTACCGGLVAIFIALAYRMMPEPNAFDQTKVVRFQHDSVLRTVVWPKAGGGVGGKHNGQVWPCSRTLPEYHHCGTHPQALVLAGY